VDVYFSSTTSYVSPGKNDVRAATLFAAADLYGVCSAEYRAVQRAWSAVNIAGEDRACGL
jgi:Zn-dependent metalloprotease